jgi:hypothetical protein
MKSFTSKLAFTLAVLAALFGPCRSGFATTVHPGDSFDISYSAPDAGPWDQVFWGLYLLSPASTAYSAIIQLDIFSSSNAHLGTDLATVAPPLEFYPELLWISNIGTLTSDPTGHVHFTILNGTFEFDPSRSFVGLTVGGPAGQVVPLPAALPLFATGLGAFGLFSWRKKRKPHEN